ncbi:MAG: DUF6089 family protein [Cryomorphaceae bacterium]
MLQKKLIIATFISLFAFGSVRSQYALDVGVNVGFANYLGEIGGGPGLARDWILDMELNQTRWNPGVFARYRLDYNWAMNFGLQYIRLQGADSLTENPNRFARNLSFRNDVIELGGTVEYYFYNQPDVGRTGRYLLDFKAYVFGGVAAFYNNPKAQLNGQWVPLQPLNTENLDKKYNRIQMAVPLGFGFYYTFSRIHRFGLNAAWRFTFTDYIDDASTVYPDPLELESEEAQLLSNRTSEVASHPLAAELVPFFRKGGVRGNPDAKDSFITVGFQYSYVIRGQSKSFGRRKNYLYGRRRGRSGRARF